MFFFCHMVRKRTLKFFEIILFLSLFYLFISFNFYDLSYCNMIKKLWFMIDRSWPSHFIIILLLFVYLLFQKRKAKKKNFILDLVNYFYITNAVCLEKITIVNVMGIKGFPSYNFLLYRNILDLCYTYNVYVFICLSFNLLNIAKCIIFFGTLIYIHIQSALGITDAVFFSTLHTIQSLNGIIIRTWEIR